MTTKTALTLLMAIATLTCLHAQTSAVEKEIVLSGARFTQPLFEAWIAGYQELHPEVKFRIENKGAAEFSDADLIIHGHELSKSEVDSKRQYVEIAKYAILPVTNARSPLVGLYAKKGLNHDQIKRIFFYDPYLPTEEEVKVPYNVYTRVQRAPSPITFAAHFGYTQDDLHGRAIAGADIHLIKSVLRDSLGITYSPMSHIYSPETGRVLEGLFVIPIDFDGNGRVSEDERFFETSAAVLDRLSKEQSKNIPVARIELAILRKGASPETLAFVAWILEHGWQMLSAHGYLSP